MNTGKQLEIQKEDTQKSFSELLENTITNPGLENLGKRSGVIHASITNRIQEMKKESQWNAKENINITEGNIPFRHELLSGKHMGDPMFSVASTHDRIFFSGICRCLFWDEGHEDSSAKCMALFVRKVDQIAA